jgi:hypothetical protein
VWFKDVLFKDVILLFICVNYDAYVDAMFKMLLIIIDAIVLWCCYDMNCLYVVYAVIEPYLRCKGQSKLRSLIRCYDVKKC